MANSYMEYYTIMRLNELHLHVIEWMMLRNIMLAGGSQTQKSTNFKNPLNNLLKQAKQIYHIGSQAGGHPWRRKE